MARREGRTRRFGHGSGRRSRKSNWNRSMFANIPTWTTERVELLKSAFCSRPLLPRDRRRDRRQPQRRDRQAVAARIDPRRGPTNAEQRTQKPAEGARRGIRRRGCSTDAASGLRRSRSRVADAADRQRRPCSLLELSKEHCRWPISTPGAEDFAFAATRRSSGLPYCAGPHAGSPTSRFARLAALSAMPVAVVT